MTHDAFAEELLDLAYGELSPREAGKVEAHAASCQACRAELARIRETRSLMARLPVEPAPEKGERILLAAAREAAERRAPRARLSPWIWRSTVVAASLALVVAVSYRFAEMRPKPLTPKAADERLLGGGYAAAPPAAPAPQAAAPGAAEGQAVRADRAERIAPPPTRSEAKKAALPREERPSRAFAQAPPAFAPAAPSGSAVASGSVGVAAPPVERRALSAPSGRAQASQADAVAAAPAPPAAASEPAPPPAQAPASRAPAPASELGALADKHEIGARRKAAPGAKAAEAARAREVLIFAEGALAPEARTFDRCEGERSRQVQVDAEGRVLRYVREGMFGGRHIRVVHVFRPDGALDSATAQDLDAGGAPVDPRALGIDIPRRAEEATLDAPPRCGR